jgi:hypothetical protein
LHERDINVNCFAVLSAGAFDLLRLFGLVSFPLMILEILGQFSHNLLALLRLRLGSDGEDDTCKLITGTAIIRTLQQINVRFISLEIEKRKGESYSCTLAVLTRTTLVATDKNLFLRVRTFGLALAILVMALVHVSNLTRN